MRWLSHSTVALLVATVLVVAPTGFAQTQMEPELGESTWAPVWSPTGQLIAFLSTKIRTEVFVVRPDGTGLRQLTSLPPGINSAFPGWSPDGRRIAFAAGLPGATQIYVVNSDGNGLKQLTSGKWDTKPAWSPDGRRIAFLSNRNGSDELFVMAPDGSTQTSLTPGMVPPLGSLSFSWAPDSRRIAVSITKVATVTRPIEVRGGTINLPTRAAGSQIHAVTVDGRAKNTLTNPVPHEDAQVAWSPDGARIAFMSERDGRFRQIYMVSPDGSRLTRLTSDGANTDPVWSPDGQRIAFMSHRDGQWQIYVMSADGSQQTRLTSVGLNWRPNWSPDGRRIAYDSERERRSRIYVINSDGTGEVQLVKDR